VSTREITPREAQLLFQSLPGMPEVWSDGPATDTVLGALTKAGLMTLVVHHNADEHLTNDAGFTALTAFLALHKPDRPLTVEDARALLSALPEHSNDSEEDFDQEVIERLEAVGMLEEVSYNFYETTAKGRAALAAFVAVG
jgi:hypothetical protein